MAVSTCNEGEIANAIKIISVIVSCVGLFIILFIVEVSVNKIRRSDNIKSVFKYLYYVAFISSLITITTVIISTFLNLFCHNHIAQFLDIISIHLYYLLLLSLLSTLILRLYYSFKGSIYKLSSLTIKLFIISFICLISLVISHFIMYIYYIIHLDQEWVMTVIIYICSANILLYLLTAGIAVFLFVKKILTLIKDRAHLNVEHSVPTTTNTEFAESDQYEEDEEEEEHEDMVEFDKQQLKLMECTSRYVGLFSLATCTSLLAGFVILAGAISMGDEWMKYFNEIVLIFAVIDCTMTVICLYLQYSFSTDIYKKYCICLDWFWRHWIVDRTSKSIKKKYSSIRKIDN